MDPMVSARVPAELRDRANSLLKELGSTPTELINRAYQELVSTGRLPGTAPGVQAGKRRLSPDAKAALSANIAASTHPIPEDYFAGRTYDDILEEELKDAYSGLA